MSSPSISVMNLRQGVQSRLALAPVVLCPPIARERLNRRELHALPPAFYAGKPANDKEHAMSATYYCGSRSRIYIV